MTESTCNRCGTTWQVSARTNSDGTRVVVMQNKATGEWAGVLKPLCLTCWNSGNAEPTNVNAVEVPSGM